MDPIKLSYARSKVDLLWASVSGTDGGGMRLERRSGSDSEEASTHPASGGRLESTVSASWAPGRSNCARFPESAHN